MAIQIDNPILRASIERDIEGGESSIAEPGKLSALIRTSDGYLMADPEWELERYMPLISELSELYEFGHSYDYMPENLSYKLYGSYDLWGLLMKLNGITTRSEFIGPTFTVVRPESVGMLIMILMRARRTALAQSKKKIQYGDLTIRPIYIQ
jgi:hypothetical protein